MPSSAVEIDQLNVRYGEVPALRSVSLTLSSGEILALVGPSGCGKTTLLRCLAGFVAPDSGRVCFDDEPIAAGSRIVPPERRGVGVVFQNYALWPHMTALDNVAYPWKVRGIGAGERRQRAAALLAQVGLAGLEQRRPAELSGGQQQRVGIARALACEPRLLLLDEPLSNVDANLRVSLQDLLRSVVRERELTTILATHDLDEACALADRIAILRDGRLVQVGSVFEINERPANAFVARFLGGMNVIPVDVLRTNGCAALVRLPGGDQIELATDSAIPTNAVLCVRPDAVHLHADHGSLSSVIARASYRGAVTEYRFALGETMLRATEAGRPAWAAGDPVKVSLGQVMLLAGDD